MINALKDTTTQTPAIAPKLVVDTVLPTADAIKAQAQLAFADNHKGGQLIGSAAQRIAYAVLCEIELLKRQGKTNHDIADVLGNAPEAKKEIVQRVVEIFCGEPPAVEKSQGKTEASERAKAEYGIKKKLVERGAYVAAIMAKRHVTFGMFNTKAGVFNVYPTMMYPSGKGFVPLGRLAKDATIMLDGRPLLYSGKNTKGDDATFTVRASIAHMLTICGPAKMPRGTPTKKGEKATVSTPFNAKKPDDVAGAIDPDVLILALHVVLCKEAPSGLVHRADFKDEVWNAWTALTAKMERSRAAPDFDAKVPVKAKTPAKRTARGH